jgi:hypothetical protein
MMAIGLITRARVVRAFARHRLDRGDDPLVVQHDANEFNDEITRQVQENTRQDDDLHNEVDA